MLRSYKSRLYPKEREETVLDDSMREAGFIYNKLLEYKISKYKAGEQTQASIRCHGGQRRQNRGPYRPGMTS